MCWVHATYSPADPFYAEITDICFVESVKDVLYLYFFTLYRYRFILCLPALTHIPVLKGQLCKKCPEFRRDLIQIRF